MSWDKIKWEALDFIGYMFCELAFRWFDIFDGPIEGDDDFRWYHRIHDLVGSTSYRAGCFFYSLQDDDYEVINESR